MASNGRTRSQVCLPSILSTAAKQKKDASNFASSLSFKCNATAAPTRSKDPLEFVSDQSTAIGSEVEVAHSFASDQSEYSTSIDTLETVAELADASNSMLEIAITAPSCQKPQSRFRRGRNAVSRETSMAPAMAGISMADVRDAINSVDPNAKVLCLSNKTTKMVDAVPNLMESPSEEVRTLTKHGIVFLLVEEGASCFCAAVEVLRNSGLVLPVLMEQFAIEDAGLMVEKISVLVQNGAEDVVVLPRSAADLSTTISVSLAKGKAHRRIAIESETKLRNAANQCDKLFWQVAHQVIEEFPEEQFDMREIPDRQVGNLALVGKLGEGHFGAVHKCKNMESGETCAVKVLSKANINSHRQLQQITTEYSVLRRVNHVNVVSGLDFLHGVKNVYIIMEMAGPINLFKMMRAEGERGMPWPKVKSLLLQIAGGVAHLHEKDIAHCDLKPENITIGEDGCAKLVDFGQAVDVLEEIPELKFPRGTMPFVAPEVMRLSTKWEPIAGDLWQIGVILFELLCGNNSFVKLMDWTGRNLMSLPDLGERAEELEALFNGSTKASTLAGMSRMWSTPPPAAAMELLTDMLELTATKRLPASHVAARLQ
jgi:hypothetical protein